MNTILGELGRSNKFTEIIKRIEKNQSPTNISGLTSVGIVQLISAINEYAKKPIVLITYNEVQAKQLIENLKYFSEKVLFFPKKEIVTYDYIAESQDLTYERIETLNKIKDKKSYILVTTIEAVMQKLPKKNILYKDSIKFKIGDIYKLEEIKKKLVNLGYTRSEMIEGKGQFSIRGGILDISIDEKTGVRIEFWGDEIDSIRSFSISSQRSINSLEKIEINPATEYVLSMQVEEICKNIRQKIVTENQEQIVEEDIEQIKAGNYISKIDKYFDEFYKEQGTILDYLSENVIIALDEESKISQRAKNIIQDTDNLINLLVEKEKIVPEALSSIQKYEQIEEKIEKSNNLIYLDKLDNITKKQLERFDFQIRDVNYYKSEIENLFKDIKKALKENKSVYVLVSNKEKAKKLQEIFEKQEILSKIEEKLDKTIIVKSKEKVATGVLLSWYLIAKIKLVTSGTQFALDIASKALDIAQGANINNYYFICLFNRLIGEIYMAKQDFDSAKVYIEKSIFIAKQFNLESILVKDYILYAKFYQELALPKSTLRGNYIKQSLKMFQQAKNISIVQNHPHMQKLIKEELSILTSFCKLNGIILKKGTK